MVVTFSEDICVILIPKNEPRKGFWEVDAARFRERIKKFEMEFNKVFKNKQC